MSLQSHITEMRPSIEQLLQEKIDRLVPPEYSELRAMLRYHMGWEGENAGQEAQGKRIRPLLVLMSTSAAGGDWKSALPFAAAVELLHNFSLIHDDIQDHSDTRRGRPTVWVKWGIPQAINAGDLLFTIAFSACLDVRNQYSDQVALQAQQLLQNTCIALTKGQYLDISYETRQTITLQDYFPMVSGKTAALLSCCTTFGGLAAGLNDLRLDSLSQFGSNLGLAFQSIDDWLGIWGDAALTGKSNESDLITRKKTLPVLYALEKDPEFVKKWEKSPFTKDELPTIAKMLISNGAQEFTLSTALSHTEQALQALRNACPEDNLAYLSLVELTESLTSRKQ